MKSTHIEKYLNIVKSYGFNFSVSPGCPVRCVDLRFVLHPIYPIWIVRLRWFLHTFPQLHTFLLFKTVVVVRGSVVSWLFLSVGRSNTNIVGRRGLKGIQKRYTIFQMIARNALSVV